MSKTLVQPIGQKRLTNVAVVRLKKGGNRFEVACYKNKVLSWRSGVEKDLDEVLQSITVYTNVSKGVLAKSKDLIAAFGHDDHTIILEHCDHTKICLEIIEKGELQVAGKERESQLSSQFRDIATIVMQRTVNPETQRPYTISMIERLMHEIHFAVDPNSSSKKQALDVIRELQKHYPIKRAPMRLRLNVPQTNIASLVEKLEDWKADIISREVTGTHGSMICEMEPGLFRDCDSFVRNLQGRLEILAVNVHADSDTHVDHYDDHEEEQHILRKDLPDPVSQLGDDLQKQTISAAGGSSVGEVKQTISAAAVSSVGGVKQNRCSTCNSVVGDSKEYREHFKSEWHKHNLKRKTRNLPPLTADECMADLDIGDSKADLKEYSF